MLRFFKFFVILLLAVSLASCSGMARRARHKIGVEGIERVVPRGVSGFGLRLKVRNETGWRLVVKRAEFDLYYGAQKIARVELRDKIVVRRKTLGGVNSEWQIRTSDAMTYAIVARKIRRGEIEKIRIAYHIRGRGGIIPIEFSGEMMPLSKFLNIFGGSIDELKFLDI